MWFGTIEELDDICQKDKISIVIEELLVEQSHTSPFEIKSWQISIPVLAKVLNIPELKNHYIFLEVRVPCSNCRCDAIVLGTGEKDNRVVAIIELKQWENCYGSKPELITFTEGDITYEKLHPCSQVEGYINYLRNYDASLVNKTNESEIYGCAFIHGMEDPNSLTNGNTKIAKKVNSELVARIPAFGKNDGLKLAKWVVDKLPKVPKKDFVREFKFRKKEPSSNLVFDLKKIANSNSHPWVPLKFQRKVYAQILNILREFKSKKSLSRKVIVVTGSPGSGKSILALAILIKAASDEFDITKSLLLTNHQYQKDTLDGALNLEKNDYVSPKRKLSSNPVMDSVKFVKDFANNRKTKYSLRKEQKKLTGKAYIPQSEFDEYVSKWRDDYLKVIDKINPVDLIVCDESQALVDPSKPKVSDMGTGKKWSPAYGPQAWHIVMSSIISIFFLDEKQGYRQQERTLAEDIIDLAKKEKIDVFQFSLGNGQFRLNGGESFVSWLDWELGVDDNLIIITPPAKDQIDDLKQVFSISDDPNEMRNRIKKLFETDKRCRLLAGYAWEWISYDKDELVDSQSRETSLNMYFKWVDKKKQSEFNLGLDPYDNAEILFGEGSRNPATVAYPLTVRGCDFSHIGVFWGLDLVWRKNNWIIQLDYVYGNDNVPWVKLAKKEIESGEINGEGVQRLIFARACAYRILLTRAMKTVRLWVEDDETREHLKQSWTKFLALEHPLQRVKMDKLKQDKGNDKKKKGIKVGLNDTKQTFLSEF